MRLFEKDTGKIRKPAEMDTSGTNNMQGNMQRLARVSGVVCLLLAVLLSMNSGIPYAASLVQTTIFYQYSVLHLSMLIST